MRSLLLIFPLLLACRPPEDLGPAGVPTVGNTDAGGKGDAGGGGGEGSRDGGGQEGQLSQKGLGKEDFALIEAELRCVAGQFAQDAPRLQQANEAILARYGASIDWIDRVRMHMDSEPDVQARLDELVRRRMAQVCVGGQLAPELLPAAPAAPAGSPSAAAGATPAATPEAPSNATPAAPPTPAASTPAP